jgi:hypothetical protein
MGAAKNLGAIALAMILIGSFARSLGLGGPNLQPIEPVEPGTGSIFQSILLPFRWAYDAITGFFQLVATDAIPLPPEIQGAIAVVLTVFVVYILTRLVRGGG